MEKTVIAMLAVMRTRRGPKRSPSVPVTGAEKADAYVRKPRNSPAAGVPPPSARIWNGAVGSSWNAERKTVNEQPHVTKKRDVNKRSGNHSDSSAMTDVRAKMIGMDRDLSNFRPSKLWRRMPLERRVDAAGLFSDDEHSADQQMEAAPPTPPPMKLHPPSALPVGPSQT